jgi:hypothetical protein
MSTSPDRLVYQVLVGPNISILLAGRLCAGSRVVVTGVT